MYGKEFYTIKFLLTFSCLAFSLSIYLDLEAVSHLILDDDTFTYDSARAYCKAQGGDLCQSDQICPNGQPIITGTLNGDQWAPIM